MNERRDTDLREALRRREARLPKPQPSPDFLKRVMEQTEPQPAARRWRIGLAALAAAACTALVVLMVWPEEEPLSAHMPAYTAHTTEGQMSEERLVATAETPQPSAPHSNRMAKPAKRKEKMRATPPPAPSQPLGPSEYLASRDEGDVEAQYHYAAHELPADTTTRVPPSRVDEFIAKFAHYYDVPADTLRCSEPADSSVVSHVYVFPDTKEIDVFGRMLQVAVSYGDDTPGYLLNFSHQQFFFQLKDLHRQLSYLWIAERLHGCILLYSTCSPIGTSASSACYLEYREQLTHTSLTLPL